MHRWTVKWIDGATGGWMEWTKARGPVHYMTFAWIYYKPSKEIVGCCVMNSCGHIRRLICSLMSDNLPLTSNKSSIYCVRLQNQSNNDDNSSFSVLICNYFNYKPVTWPAEKLGQYIKFGTCHCRENQSLLPNKPRERTAVVNEYGAEKDLFSTSHPPSKNTGTNEPSHSNRKKDFIKPNI